MSDQIPSDSELRARLEEEQANRDRIATRSAEEYD